MKTYILALLLSLPLVSNAWTGHSYTIDDSELGVLTFEEIDSRMYTTFDCGLKEGERIRFRYVLDDQLRLVETWVQGTKTGTECYIFTW